jgi:hypothetical protein
MDLQGKHVFLSGPMTGLPDHNRAAFADAERWCVTHGAEVAFNPTTAWGHADRGRAWYMLRDIHRLTEPGEADGPLFDLVVQLDGWERSNGAYCECRCAEACGIPCVPLRSLMEVK